MPSQKALPERAEARRQMAMPISKQESRMMSIDEIRETYRDQWVLIGDPQLTEALEVLGGRVLCHSAAREELYRQARELQANHAAILYLGDRPHDVAVNL
jgi:hypothetical protein